MQKAAVVAPQHTLECLSEGAAQLSTRIGFKRRLVVLVKEELASRS